MEEEPSEQASTSSSQRHGRPTAGVQKYPHPYTLHAQMLEWTGLTDWMDWVTHHPIPTDWEQPETGWRLETGCGSAKATSSKSSSSESRSSSNGSEQQHRNFNSSCHPHQTTPPSPSLTLNSLKYLTTDQSPTHRGGAGVRPSVRCPWHAYPPGIAWHGMAWAWNGT